MNEYEREEMRREEPFQTAPENGTEPVGAAPETWGGPMEAVPGPETEPENAAPEVSENVFPPAAPENSFAPEPPAESFSQEPPAESFSQEPPAESFSQESPEEQAPAGSGEASQPNILEQLWETAEERAAQALPYSQFQPDRPGSFAGRQGPGPYGGPAWSQPPQYGPNTTGWQQPSQYGPNTTGWQQPPQYGPNAAGWQQPPQYSPNTTGWQQPGKAPRQPSGGYQPQQAPAPRREPAAKAAENTQAPPVKKKKRGVFRVLLRVAAVLAVLALVAGAGYGGYVAATGDNPLYRPDDSAGAIGGGSSGGNSVPDIVINDRPEGEDRYDGREEGTLSNNAIFNKVSPSVVGVVARTGDSFYGDSSQGSGIIMSEDGYIITNAHVVEGAVSYEIVLTGGESYQAQLVGADRNSDIAVLKVNETGLPFAEFGNSDQVEVGERVCVIGNPGGLRLQNSLTVGYISALKRTISTNGYSIDCLQTDAAVNPGNSGGPLINAYGQVIGITSAKIALTDYEGICFAIPISDAIPIVRQLIADGKVTGRAMLGITAKAVRASEAEYYEIPLGLWVVTVTPGADIGAKGIREGDIITHIDDTPIYSLDACSNVLKNHKPGDTVTITVFRREGSMTDNTFKADIVLQGS